MWNRSTEEKSCSVSPFATRSRKSAAARTSASSSKRRRRASASPPSGRKPACEEVSGQAERRAAVLARQSHRHAEFPPDRARDRGREAAGSPGGRDRSRQGRAAPLAQGNRAGVLPARRQRARRGRRPEVRDEAGRGLLLSRRRGASADRHQRARQGPGRLDRKSTRLNSSHTVISYAVVCLKKKTNACWTIRHGPRSGTATSRRSTNLPRPAKGSGVQPNRSFILGCTAPRPKHAASAPKPAP